MTSRNRILDSVRASLGRGRLSERRMEELDARMKAHRPNVIPARGQLEPAERIELFVKMAKELAATVDRIESETDVPRAVARFLADSNLPAEARVAPDLKGLPWDGAGLLKVDYGTAQPGDLVSVTPTVGAVAETGTIVLASGKGTPTLLNFLPDVHVAVVRADQVMGAYEEAWATLRRKKHWPRIVNFVTGPSRTADIEQTLLLGAHGPRRLHILLVG